MIRIDMTKDGIQDRATAFWNGQEYVVRSAKGASMALARLLVAAGCPDGPYEAGRHGKKDFYGPSLHRLAKLTVEESDKTGPRFTKWQPRPELTG